MVDFTGYRVLIIEDEPQLLSALGHAFRRAGAYTVLASNGADGLKRFPAAQPDLVITDIIMPEREGVETLMAIKAARPCVPVLAISGGGRTPAGEFLTLARGLGADAVLAKPFRSRDILEKAYALIPSGQSNVAA